MCARKLHFTLYCLACNSDRLMLWEAFQKDNGSWEWTRLQKQIEDEIKSKTASSSSSVFDVSIAMGGMRLG